MRKILLLSTVFAFSFCVFTQNNAEAAWATTWWQAKNDESIKDVEIAVKDNTEALETEINELETEINERFMDLYGELMKMSEQQTAVNTANTRAGGAFTSASDQNRAITAREVVDTSTAKTWVNADGQNCVIASAGKGTSVVSEGAEEETEKLIVERMKTINSEAGTDSANGLVDFQRNMFERSKALCDPSGNGGANTFCAGSGSSHITLATILTPLAFQNQSPLTERLEYMQDVLFSRIPISVNPDLLENPNTETMNMVVESDRIKAEMSIGQTLFSILQGNRTKIDSTIVSSLRDRLQAGGWSGQKIDNMTAGGVSKNSMYHALTLGSYSSEMLLQKASANDRDLLANVFGELALNNVLQFEQYKLLEAIALATATNIVVNRDDAIKDLNARISSANSR